MKQLNIKTALLFLFLSTSTLLSNTCEDAVPFDDFLKEMNAKKQSMELLNTKLSVLESENQTLYSKIKSLENKIANFKHPALKKKKEKNYKGLYKVAIKEANIYIENHPKSAVAFELVREERVQIENCDKFGWCKLLNKNLFIIKSAIVKAD